MAKVCKDEDSADVTFKSKILVDEIFLSTPTMAVKAKAIQTVCQIAYEGSPIC